MKGGAEEPPGSALTLTIKEETISVKHVFSPFTLYANVFRRVKVPFDETQQEFVRKEHSLEPVQEKTPTLGLSFLAPQIDSWRSLRAQEMPFPRCGFVRVQLLMFCKLNTFSFFAKTHGNWCRELLIKHLSLSLL